MNTPQIDDMLIWLGGCAAAVLAITAAFVVFRKWLIGSVIADIDEVKKELRPNGGSSVRDAIDRIAERQQEIQEDVKEVRSRVDDHIAWHLDN